MKGTVPDSIINCENIYFYKNCPIQLYWRYTCILEENNLYERQYCINNEFLMRIDLACEGDNTYL
jgi:hypothetical protein